MNALCSLTTGVLVRPDPNLGLPIIHYLSGQPEWHATERFHLFSVIDDWEDVESVPAVRSAIARIGGALSDCLFPGGHALPATGSPATEVDEWTEDDQAFAGRKRRFGSRRDYERATQEVDAITKLLAKGQDSQATRYLDSLVGRQFASGSREYVLKSLCNIAQRCADMFRIDFERRCLETALNVEPNDPWTLIQWGNHLKRVGAFDDAIGFLKRAAFGENERIARASIADVYVKRRDYDKAVEEYQSIANWTRILEIRTALADILRFRGELERAVNEYDGIIAAWSASTCDRAVAGKAEIAKYRGQFDEAIGLYDSLLVSNRVDQQAQVVYESAKCTVLKNANRLSEAFELSDRIVHKIPFSMPARIQHASILGLHDKAQSGLGDVPDCSSRQPEAFEAWRAEYCRGLLLLKLDRFEPAKLALHRRFNLALLTEDDETVVRLGAAIAFLFGWEIPLAARELAHIVSSRDFFSQYVCNVLRLHVAVAQSDEASVERLVVSLSIASERDPTVKKAIEALKRKDFPAALQFELELLLRLAA